MTTHVQLSEEELRDLARGKSIRTVGPNGGYVVVDPPQEGLDGYGD